MYDDLEFLITTKCGSRAFNLQDDDSDYDYFSIINTPDESYGDINRWNEIWIDNKDYFCLHISSLYDIAVCGSPLIVPYYDSIVSYNSEVLYNFWLNNSSDLSEINLWSTYNTTINQVSYDLGRKSEKSYSICVRLIALIWCRYFVKDILTAKNLSSVWVDRYKKVKSGEFGFSEVSSYLEEIKTKSFLDFYRSQPINYSLHDEYKKILDQILGG